MNFKERILTTLNPEEPDQIPVMGLIMESSTVSQVTGKSSTHIVNFLDKPVLGSMAKRLVNFTKLIYENPDFVKRVVAFQTELYLRYFEGVMESGVEVVLGGDDFGQKTGPLMRPALIDKIFGESYRRVAFAPLCRCHALAMDGGGCSRAWSLPPSGMIP